MRRILISTLPIFVLVSTLLLGFLFWGIGTQQGSRWVLRTAAHYLDGHALGIRGSIWGGLTVDEFLMKVPAAAVRIEKLELEMDWRALLQRRLHAQNISMGVLDVDLIRPEQEETESEPFAMPVIPISVDLDRFYLGELNVKINAEPLLLNVRDLLASLSLNDEGARLVFDDLMVGRDGIEADIKGELRLLELADPWPLEFKIQTHAHSTEADSMLCVRHFLPELPQVSTKEEEQESATTEGEERKESEVDEGDEKVNPITELSQLSAACALDVEAQVTGDLDRLALQVHGAGQDVQFDVNANLTPRAGFPLSDGTLDLRLADGSSLHGQVNWQVAQEGASLRDHVVGALRADKLNLRLLAGDAVPEGAVTANLGFDAQLLNHQDLLSARLELDFEEGSRWNGQAVGGKAHFNVDNVVPVQEQTAEQRQGDLWKGLQLSELDIDLRVGEHHIKGQGDLGMSDSRLSLDIQANQLADLWPDLPGGANAHLELAGGLASHEATFKGVYTPADPNPQKLGQAPIQLDLALRGGWGAMPSSRAGQQSQPAESQDNAPPDRKHQAAATPDPQGGPQQQPAQASESGQEATTAAFVPDAPLEGWRGEITRLNLDHAGVNVALQSPLAASFAPAAVMPDWQWQLGQTALRIRLPSGAQTVLRHSGSRGGAGRWETAGGADQVVISQAIVEQLEQLIPTNGDNGDEDRGRVITPGEEAVHSTDFVFAGDWDLQFAGALQGEAHIRRLSGDVVIPAEPSFPMGLQELTVDITARPVSASASRVTAQLRVGTKGMGDLEGEASALLHSPPGEGFFLSKQDPTTFSVDANIQDLGWISLFAGDAMQFGGSVQAHVEGRSRADGSWDTTGTVTGQGIRIVRIDDGVRLLDGELRAHLEGDRFILDSLYFPARLRVAPNEWRTQEWVTTNPEAKGGGLTLSGSWSLYDQQGGVNIDFHRYPILQRSDRYAMVSGQIRVDVPYPRIDITGELVADAGWVDLDMLSSVPTIDGDVIVLRPGETLEQKTSAPQDISMDLTIDLGPRFYITGYGVDSGLVGKLRVLMRDGKILGEGALRTRGGAIDVFGQHLQLRRGSLTFQGDITNPVLNIEAVRTDQAVQAGVRVAGTAKRPRIDLISTPEVSEVQKLSWLLFGHGADESGADAAMLLSVGASFLTDGEPFYRRFGIDELSMRSGELGSAGSILPVESVVRGLDSATSDIERRFLRASKGLGNGVTLSIEQALSDTGTVGRLSYRLARDLSAQLTVGTVNGIALVYRRISRD